MEELLKKIGVIPNNKKLYEQAFTHTSYSFEHNLKESYETLEFLGDAIVDLVVSDYLYNSKLYEEGEMTKIRASYVCENALYDYGMDLGFSQYIKVGHGETITGGKYKKAIVADVFEALMGAIYIDLGYEKVKQVALGIIVPYIEDKNVYDGMNQALSLCKGDYLLFLNCGDFFHDAQVLEHVAEWIEKGLKKQSAEEQVKQQKENEVKQEKESKEGWKNRNAIPAIYYGNTFCSRTGAMVHSAPSITGFTCYRNIPCHQSCFYDRRLFEKKQYDTSLKVRADYDHFLWCFYVKKASFRYMDIIISDYEGGGISEVEENRRLDQEEHKLVTKRYMSSGELLKYKTIMLLTLAPLRRKLAEDSALSGVYHRFKNIIYGK